MSKSDIKHYTHTHTHNKIYQNIQYANILRIINNDT